jgi:hypothetical protein
MNTGEYPNGNTAIGTTALSGVVVPLTTGRDNTALGFRALKNLNSDKNESTAVGANALYANTSGENTGVGAYAGSENATGTGNTSVGNWAQRYQEGDENTAVGHRAFAGSLSETVEPTNNGTGNGNTAVGYDSLRSNVMGESNVAVGHSALMNNLGTAINQGHQNVAVGADALLNNTSGLQNTSVGYQSGQTLTTGSHNTLVGSATDVILVSHSKGTALGHLAKVDAKTHGTAIGAESLVERDNSIVLGRPPKPTDDCNGSAVDYVGIGTTTPAGALHVVGGHVNKVIKFTSAPLNIQYNATADDYIILADNSSNDGLTVVLPLLSSSSKCDGHTFIVKNVGSANNVVVDSDPGITKEFFDDVTVPNITLALGESVTFVNYDSVYYVIAKYT